MSDLVMGFSRQRNLINYQEFKGKTVSIIGCGAVGSEIARGLNKIGFAQPNFGKIKLFDFDNVGKHNLSNQWFYPKQVGMQKVEALSQNLEMFDCVSEWYDKKVESEDMDCIREIDADIIFLCVDSNDSRRDIMEDIIPYCGSAKAVIETGMSLTGSRCQYYNTLHWDDVMESWLKKWKPSSEQKVSDCGISETAYQTVAATALEALKNFTRHYNEYWAENKNPLVGAPVSSYDMENFLMRGTIKKEASGKTTIIR